MFWKFDETFNAKQTTRREAHEEQSPTSLYEDWEEASRVAAKDTLLEKSTTASTNYRTSVQTQTNARNEEQRTPRPHNLRVPPPNDRTSSSTTLPRRILSEL